MLDKAAIVSAAQRREAAPGSPGTQLCSPAGSFPRGPIPGPRAELPVLHGRPRPHSENAFGHPGNTGPVWRKVTPGLVFPRPFDKETGPRGGFLWTEASRVALPRPGFQRERILHPGAPARKRRRSLSLRGSGSAGLREGCPPPPTPALLAGSASRSPGPGSPAAARPRRGFRGGPAQGPGLCERLLSAYLFHLFSATQFEAINIDARR